MSEYLPDLSDEEAKKILDAIKRVGEGERAPQDIIDAREAAAILFTIIAAIRNRFPTYAEAYNALYSLPIAAATANGRSSSYIQPFDIPLYRFLIPNEFRVDEPGPPSEPVLAASAKFFLTFFPQFMHEPTLLAREYKALTADENSEALDKDKKVDVGAGPVVNYTYVAFQSLLENSGIDSRRLVNIARLAGSKLKIRFSSKVGGENGGNAVISINNEMKTLVKDEDTRMWKYTDANDPFWHITAFQNSSYKFSLPAWGIRKGTVLNDSIHFTSERSDKTHSFVAFSNFETPYNNDATKLIASLGGRLDHGEQLRNMKQIGNAPSMSGFSDKDLHQLPSDSSGPVVGRGPMAAESAAPESAAVGPGFDLSLLAENVDLSTIEAIDADIRQTYLVDIAGSEEQISKDTYGVGALNNGQYESVDTSANYLDCLIHSFLISTCPSFRRLSMRDKNEYADRFRRTVFPTFYSDEERADPAQHFADIAPHGTLQDIHAEKLASIYRINIMMFIRTQVEPQTITLTPVGIEYEDRPCIVIYNPGDLHYRAVRRIADGQFLFPYETRLDLLLNYAPQLVGGKKRAAKIASSLRPLYGPTRKDPSSARARRHTHRKRASRSGKVGYRATRTGRKA